MIESRDSIPAGWISIDDAVEIAARTGRRIGRDQLYGLVRKGRVRCVKDTRPWLVPIGWREELAERAS